MFQYYVRDLGNIQKNDGGIIMTYKVIFKRFRFDTDNTIVFVEAKTAEAAADVVRHYYHVGSNDILSVTAEE